MVVFGRNDKERICLADDFAVTWIFAFWVVAITREIEVCWIYEYDFDPFELTGELSHVLSSLDRLPFLPRSASQNGHGQRISHRFLHRVYKYQYGLSHNNV